MNETSSRQSKNIVLSRKFVFLIDLFLIVAWIEFQIPVIIHRILNRHAGARGYTA